MDAFKSPPHSAAAAAAAAAAPEQASAAAATACGKGADCRREGEEGAEEWRRRTSYGDGRR